MSLRTVASVIDARPDQWIVIEVNGNVRAASVVTCPRYNWQCDMPTGTSMAHPSANVERYTVQLESTDVQVKVSLRYRRNEGY